MVLTALWGFKTNLKWFCSIQNKLHSWALLKINDFQTIEDENELPENVS